jgi:hypothetical protein
VVSVADFGVALEDLVQLVMTMREMTAAEALRNFSAVLDEAERGEAIVVTRGGGGLR